MKVRNKMDIGYQEWPIAIRNFGYYPPESVIQVPMKVFKRMLDETPTDKHPDWTQEAINSGQENVLMLGKTFCGLVGDTVPQWMFDTVDQNQGEGEQG
jgi:hypothetical protein